jgi:hypothetical protein
VVPAAKPTAAQLGNDLAWITLAFLIFNTYMLIFSLFVNKAVFAVFLTLEITELILIIGNFGSSTSAIKLGGYLGIITAGAAWYASAAGVLNGLAGKHVIPVGKPMPIPGAS